MSLEIVPFLFDNVKFFRIVLNNVPTKLFTHDVRISFSSLVVGELSIDCNKVPKIRSNPPTLRYNLDGLMPFFAGDFKISFRKKEKTVCFVWLNSEFLYDEVRISKLEIDKASKKKKWGSDFTVDIFSRKDC